MTAVASKAGAGRLMSGAMCAGVVREIFERIAAGRLGERWVLRTGDWRRESSGCTSTNSCGLEPWD